MLAVVVGRTVPMLAMPTLEAMVKLTVRCIGCLAVATGTILRPAGRDVRIVSVRRRAWTRATGVAARPSRCTEKAKNGVPFIEKRFSEKRYAAQEWPL